MRCFAVTVLASLLGSAAVAKPPDLEPIPLPLPLPPDPIKLKSPKSVEQPKLEEVAGITKMMREAALQHMPVPLVTAEDGWGKQKEFAVGKILLRNPLKASPEMAREKFNDGLWRRFTVSARDPIKSLGIGITELVKPADDTMHITINVAMDINFRVEQQFWVRGRQLYSGETRGHCRGAVQLKATAVQKLAFKPGAVVPDVTVKVTTTDAKLFYEKIVIDHALGLDGESAEKAGDLVIDLVKSVKPDLEKELLEKANAAILKAAGTKEFKLELDKLAKFGAAPKKK